MTYEFSWQGSQDAHALASAPARSRLTSGSFADIDRRNAVIEGDNLDALKLLQPHLRESVKVIYIDPPYNTGNQLPYRDTFGLAGHAGWLSMMLPRLELARSLLRPDGVVFAQVDDREQAFLTLAGHQVFGEENFLGTFIHQRAKGGGQAPTWARGHDYILVWARNAAQVGPFLQAKKPPAKTEIIDGQPFVVETDVLRGTFGKYERGTERRLMYEDIEAVRGPKKKQQVDAWLAAGTHQLRPWGEDGKHAVVRVTPAHEAASKMYSILKALGSEGRNDLAELGLDGYFQYPKPVSLIKQLVLSQTFADRSGIVVDFFAGSGTTGQAVLELNAEDGGERTFVLVQKPEALRRKAGPGSVGAGTSAAAGAQSLTAGTADPAAEAPPATISELTRMRVRAAGRALRADHPELNVDFEDIRLQVN